MKIIKRYLFYCAKCGFEYSGGSAEPCSCSFCGAVNERCYIDEMVVEEKSVLDCTKILPAKMSSRKCLNCGTEFLIHSYEEQLEKKAEEKSKTSCVYCEHYTTCYKLRHDRSVYDKGCEDFEKDLFFIELSGEED